MKKNNILKSFIVVATFAMALAVLPSTVLAETADTAESEATITFEAGELTLLSAPSFNFGTNAIPSVETDYSAEASTEVLTVSDLRGSDAGWAVTVALNPFQNGGDTLAGSYITLSAPDVVAQEGTMATAPVAVESITLTSDGTATAIENAAVNTGSGVWDTSFGSVVLKVYPGTAKTGTNTGTIDWYLSDTP